MSKDIKGFLHLYAGHIDCVTDSGTIGRLITVNTEAGIAVIRINPEMGQTISKLYSELKPILRNLSSMTEEEAKSIHSIQHGGHPDTYTRHEFDIRRAGSGWSIVRLDSMDIKLIVTDHGNLWKAIEEDGNPPHVEPMQYQNEIFRYLLSKGFDLFGLCESGLAIEKKAEV